MRVHGGQNPMNCAETVSALEGYRTAVGKAAEEGASAGRIMGFKVGKIINVVFAENTTTQHDLLQINGFVNRFNAVIECLKEYQTKLVHTEAPTEAPTNAPTEPPSEALTEAPTEATTEAPTEAPTVAPDEAPEGTGEDGEGQADAVLDLGPEAAEGRQAVLPHLLE